MRDDIRRMIFCIFCTTCLNLAFATLGIVVLCHLRIHRMYGITVCERDREVEIDNTWVRDQKKLLKRD